MQCLGSVQPLAFLPGVANKLPNSALTAAIEWSLRVVWRLKERTRQGTRLAVKRLSSCGLDGPRSEWPLRVPRQAPC